MSALNPGTLGRLGLLRKDRLLANKDLIGRIAADKLETVRFLFVDQHGILRGKTIVADAVGSVLQNGITAPSSLLLKDTSGRTVFPVWEEDAGFGAGVMTGAADMLLVPDPDTYRHLPWSTHSAWVLCDLVQTNGENIPFSSRTVLAKSNDLLAKKGMNLTVGLEVEFHIFKLADRPRTHDEGGMPGAPPETLPLNQGYSLLGEVAYAEAEPILDELRRTAQALGLPVRSVEIEFGPSQFELTFDPATSMTHADNMVIFRTMVKEVCARLGLHATFMTKPDLPNCAASGWHIHQSLVDHKTGRNLFEPHADQLTDQAAGWIAGLLKHAAESCIFTTPTVNGYGRYQPGQLAPDRIQWARNNRGAMLRALLLKGEGASRLENRIAEPSANPYYAFTSQILSGLDGIENALQPPPPTEKPYDNSVSQLPDNLGEAIKHFDNGKLYSTYLGESFQGYVSKLKRAEWDRYQEKPDGWEQREYFQLF